MLPSAAITTPTRHKEPQTALLRFALYARKSTEQDERQTQSIGSQVSRVQELAERSGWLITHEREESRSAKEPGRPLFNELLALADAGEIDGILAWHPDRLARNELDAAQVVWRLRKGVLKELAFVEYFFHNSPEGIMMLQMALSQSQYQVSKLAIEVTRGLEDKVKMGWLPHRAPLGYQNDTHLLKGQKTISPDPERFPLIEKAWQMLLSEAGSVPQIAEVLNQKWGMRTPLHPKGGGEPVAPSTLYRVFGNPFYAGLFVHKGQLHQGAHQPMVTLDEFRQAQKILGRTSKIPIPSFAPDVGALVEIGATEENALPLVPRDGQQGRHTFLGILRCKACGGAVTATTVRKPSGIVYTYYHCSQGKKNGRCHKGGIRSDRLEATLDAAVASLEPLPEFAEWAEEEMEKTEAALREAQEAVHRQREQAMAATEEGLDRLLGLRLRDLIGDEEFAAKRAELVAEGAQLKEAAAREGDGENTAVAAQRTTLGYLIGARRWLNEGSPAARRQVVKNLVSNLWLDGGNALLELNPALAPIAEEYPRLKGRYEAIKLGDFGSGKAKVRALEGVRSAWSRIWEVNQTLAESDVQVPGANAIAQDSINGMLPTAVTTPQ